MANVQLWIQVMWSTKNKNPILTNPDRTKLFDYLVETSKEKGIYIDTINGEPDHIHLLISLQMDQSLLKIIQSIKAESCYWAKRQKLFDTELEWQSDFLAISVSHSALESVREYILQQEQIHTQKTYQQEYDAFVKKYGFQQQGPERPRARTIKTRGYNTGLVMRTE